MRALHRASPKVIPVLESLDTRVVPASIGLPRVGASSLVESLLTRLVPARPGSGAPGQRFNPGDLLGAVSGLGNVPPARLSTGTGVPARAPSVGLNPTRDHALGRQPVVVGLQGPGIGLFTNSLAIQFRQGSAAASRPFNAVPGAGATFGIAFV